MNKTNIPEPDLGNFLKQTLKDDLPPEAEARMSRQFLNFKRTLDRPEVVAERDTRTRRGVLYWPDRWLRAGVAFRKEILAFASMVMLILGVVMQLGGDQSVLADSIERLKVMITVSAGLYRVTSMDCTVLKPGAGGENSQYRVRWNAAGVTRVDMDSTNGTEQTLWISKGTVSVAAYEGGAVRSTAIATMPSKWQPPMEFLTPTILAQHMEERYGLMQAGSRDGAGSDEFLLVGQENQQVIEIAIDARTYLPTTLKKYLLDSGRTGKERDCLEEVRFQWNKPIPQELLVSGSSVVKRQVN